MKKFLTILLLSSLVVGGCGKATPKATDTNVDNIPDSALSVVEESDENTGEIISDLHELTDSDLERTGTSFLVNINQLLDVPEDYDFEPYDYFELSSDSYRIGEGMSDKGFGKDISVMNTDNKVLLSIEILNDNYERFLGTITAHLEKFKDYAVGSYADGDVMRHFMVIPKNADAEYTSIEMFYINTERWSIPPEQIYDTIISWVNQYDEAKTSFDEAVTAMHAKNSNIKDDWYVRMYQRHNQEIKYTPLKLNSSWDYGYCEEFPYNYPFSGQYEVIKNYDTNVYVAFGDENRFNLGEKGVRPVYNDNTYVVYELEDTSDVYGYCAVSYCVLHKPTLLECFGDDLFKDSIGHVKSGRFTVFPYVVIGVNSPEEAAKCIDEVIYK